MSRCPNCDTPLHITRAASPVIECDSAREYRMNAIHSAAPKPPESSPESAKVIHLEPGDWWSDYGGMLYMNRGDCTNAAINGSENGWIPLTIHGHLHTRLTDSEGDARAAALGYSVKRAEKVEAVAAKVEPTRAVFEFEPNDVATTTENGSTYLYRGDVCYLFAREDEKQPMVSWCHAGMRNTDERNMHRTEIIELLNKRGITAKFPEPTPASDSVKGERDRHGRSIIARNDYAMIVRTDEPENDQPYLIVDSNAKFYWVGSEWAAEEVDDLPHTGYLFKDEAIKKLAIAATTPLPKVEPQAAKVEDGPFWCKHTVTGKMNAYATVGQREHVLRSGNYWAKCDAKGQTI